MPNYQEMTDMGQSSTKKNSKEEKELKDVLKGKENEKEKGKEKGKERESEAPTRSKVSKIKGSTKPPVLSKSKIIDPDHKTTSTVTKTLSDTTLVHEVKNFNDFEARLKRAGNGLVVIDFYATWCIPCKVAAPQVDRLAEEMKDITFLKVDVDENEALAVKYNVSTMPNFVIIKQGKVVETVIGFNANKIEFLLKKHREVDSAESKEKKTDKRDEKVEHTSA